MAMPQGDPSSQGLAGWQGSEGGDPQTFSYSDTAQSTPGVLPGCGWGAGRSSAHWLPGHCSLHGQRKGSLWKEDSQYGGVGCMHWTWGEAHGGFFSCSSPLRLSRKYFSHIPGCPSGCFGVGENTCWSPCNLHGFNANTKAEFQELVKCGFFSKRLM